MKKLITTFSYGITLLMISMVLLVSCSDKKDTPTEPKIPEEETIIPPPPVVFTAIGDVPYNEEQRTALVDLIPVHNAKSTSEFIIHVGDIKPGADACDEAVYEDVSSLLKNFDTPTFIILGDNEFNDCEIPTQGLAYWNQYFLHFNEQWQFDQTVTYQPERVENFSWVENKVLFIGINLVGSSVHDSDEWNSRLTDNGNWVKQLLETYKDSTEAAVVFGHANIVNLEPEKFNTFTNVFRAASAVYSKPVLYLQGDGHFWLENRPWPEKNILRVQITGGAEAVQVTVDTANEDPFSFDTSFLDQ